MAETVEKKEDVLDFSTLENRLAELSASDFLKAERECRMSGDPTPDVTTSTDFHARLAAKAMGVPYDKIKSLKLSEFFSVASRVKIFLMAPLGEMVAQRNA